MVGAQNDEIHATFFRVAEDRLTDGSMFHELPRPAKCVATVGKNPLQRAEKLLLVFSQEIRTSDGVVRNDVNNVELAARGSGQGNGVWRRVHRCEREVGGVQHTSERQHVRCRQGDVRSDR